MSKKQQPDLIIFDLETTGLDPVRHEILEIGAVRVSADLRTVRAELNEKVRPNHPETADPKGIEVNGYSEDAWKDAQPMSTVVPAFLEFIKDGMLGGFNVAFDWMFLAHVLELWKYGETWPFDYHVFDVFSVAYERMQESGTTTTMTLRGLCQQYGVPVPPKPHRALDDAKATLGLLRAIRNI